MRRGGGQSELGEVLTDPEHGGTPPLLQGDNVLTGPEHGGTSPLLQGDVPSLDQIYQLLYVAAPFPQAWVLPADTHNIHTYTCIYAFCILERKRC